MSGRRCTTLLNVLTSKRCTKWDENDEKIHIVPNYSIDVSALLDDKLNLEILENICSGTGVEVNISSLAKDLGKHRDTIRSQVTTLFEQNIINTPVYPFRWLFQEYPLLVIVNSDLPKDEKTEHFVRTDEHIFGAFYVKDEEYNMFLIEFFKDITSHMEWRKRIVAEHKIPPRDVRYPASASYFSTKHVIKYQPHSPIFQMEEKQRQGEELKINGYTLNTLSLQILKRLMTGKNFRTNENQLAKILDVNRKTVERRISNLLEEKIIGSPVCRFPRFFVPSSQFLVYYLVEIKKSYTQVIQAIKSDPCIPFALEASIGRYNLLMFQVFSSVDEHLEWEDRYTSRFPGSLGAMKNIYLSPNMTVSIDQQKIALGIIKNRKEALRGREIMESIR